MASPRLQDRLHRWEILNANLKQHLQDLPDLTAKQAEFEAIIEEDLVLAAEYNQLIGSARSITAERQALTRTGNQLRNVFVETLRHRFGPENQQLNEFGIRPRAFRRRPPRPATEPEPEPEPMEIMAPGFHLPIG